MKEKVSGCSEHSVVYFRRDQRTAK